ncbi:unnamed protein product, partial [Sphagnum tenellum]
LQSERLDIKSAIDLVTNRVMSPELQAQRALEQAQLLQHPKLLPLDVLDIETATAMKAVFKRSLEVLPGPGGPPTGATPRAAAPATPAPAAAAPAPAPAPTPSASPWRAA